MKKLLILVILSVWGFCGFSGTPQTAREALAQPVFPKVDYEDVELQTTLRHLFQRPECRELGLSYGVASNVKECRVTIKEQQISLFQFLNLICLQNQLRFSFKDNYLHFYNDTRSYSFSQTTTGNRNVDARLSQIIFPSLLLQEADYAPVLHYLSNKAVKHSGTKKKEFIFVWTYHEKHATQYRLNYALTQNNLLSIIQKICRQGKLEFRYTDGILLFVPRRVGYGNFNASDAKAARKKLALTIAGEELPSMYSLDTYHSIGRWTSKDFNTVRNLSLVKEFEQVDAETGENRYVCHFTWSYEHVNKSYRLGGGDLVPESVKWYRIKTELQFVDEDGDLILRTKKELENKNGVRPVPSLKDAPLRQPSEAEARNQLIKEEALSKTTSPRLTAKRFTKNFGGVPSYDFDFEWKTSDANYNYTAHYTVKLRPDYFGKEKWIIEDRGFSRNLK